MDQLPHPPAPREPQPSLWWPAWRVALIYALVASVWIVSTDVIVAVRYHQPLFAQVTAASQLKGLFFVAVTAALLLGLVHHALAQLQRSEERRRASEARFRRVTESNMIGIFSWTLDGTITHANEAFLALVGYTQAEVAAGTLRWPALTPPNYAGTLHEAGDQLQQRGVFAPVEKEYLRKDGSRVAVLVGGALLGPSSQEGVSFVLDMTERKRTLAQLRAAKDTAEAASRTKDLFLALVSHELRTPLTPILAQVVLLEREPDLPLHVRVALEMIRRNIEQEAGVIGNLLDTIHVSRGELALALAPLDAHAAVRGAVQACRQALAAKSLTLDLDLAAAHHHVRGDAARLQQVFAHLIDNAVKYSPEFGHITLTSKNTAGALTITVRDQGIGMTPELMARLFTPFAQGEQSLRRQYGGLGLGLSLAKILIEQQDGTLTAASAGPDLGSVFTVTLPVSAPAPQPATVPPAAAPPSDPTGRSYRILLVEDNADTLRVLTHLLRILKHTVFPARTAEEALQAARQDSVDLLLSDIGLPDATGWDLLTQLRRQHPDLPAVALSGFVAPEDFRRSQAAGFREHLAKPINPDELERVIARVMAGPH